MKELRILLASICLVYLVVLSPSLSASSEENEHPRSQIERHESDDDDSIEHQNEKKQEIAKKNKERLKKIAELRKKNKKIVRIVVPKTPVTPVAPKTPVTPTTPSTPVKPVVATVTKSSTVSYRTPAGSDAITFTATVKGGVIVAASSVTKAQNGTSIWYQDTFSAKVSQAVVGKKVAGLNLSAIGGASLTTTAFEQFIASSF